MKVLITGANGFLGTYFARHLDCDLDAYGRADLDLTNADQVKSCVKSGGYDVILHCASAGRNHARSFESNIIENNLVGFANLVSCRHDFGTLINFATGAEFDIDLDINNAPESAIWSVDPKHSYGRSKNLIARQVQMLPNFYNLRIFGCFDSSENNTRPIKAFVEKSQQGQPFAIAVDRRFDMFGVADILTVVRAIMANQISDKDLNLVYNNKYTLSEILKMFARLHDLDPDLVQVGSMNTKNYTGCGYQLAKYDLDLLGLEQSLLNYTL